MTTLGRTWISNLGTVSNFFPLLYVQQKRNMDLKCIPKVYVIFSHCSNRESFYFLSSNLCLVAFSLLSFAFSTMLWPVCYVIHDYLLILSQFVTASQGTQFIFPFLIQSPLNQVLPFLIVFLLFQGTQISNLYWMFHGQKKTMSTFFPALFQEY